MSVRTCSFVRSASLVGPAPDEPVGPPHDGSALAFGTLFSSQGARFPRTGPCPVRHQEGRRFPDDPDAPVHVDRLRQASLLDQSSVLRKVAPTRNPCSETFPGATSDDTTLPWCPSTRASAPRYPSGRLPNPPRRGAPGPARAGARPATLLAVDRTEGEAGLLEWYQPRRSRYPWRVRPSPYGVLVSEVMLQQAQAARVAPAYTAFIERFPTLRALAAAPLREVLRAWTGLGYSRRAVGLRASARAIVALHGGEVPGDPDILRGLPGIGSYTAAAVASLAHGAPMPALDTNVRRVVARARLGVDSQSSSPPDIARAAREWMGGHRSADWNQAVMDLGREVCRPFPKCGACPISGACRYHAADRAGKASPRPRPRPHPRRPPPPFRGSTRELRGRILALLLDRASATLSLLAGATNRPVPEVTNAVAGLALDGLLAAGPAALAGRPSGRVRLAD
jgi:A/G-specific adenine glycosylase